MTSQREHRAKRARYYKRCIHCGAEKKLPTTKYIPRTEYEADEFCSRKCCEEHLGVSDE